MKIVVIGGTGLIVSLASKTGLPGLQVGSRQAGSSQRLQLRKEPLDVKVTDSVDACFDRQKVDHFQ